MKYIHQSKLLLLASTSMLLVGCNPEGPTAQLTGYVSSITSFFNESVTSSKAFVLSTVEDIQVLKIGAEKRVEKVSSGLEKIQEGKKLIQQGISGTSGVVTQ